jgi:hypothetical protein
MRVPSPPIGCPKSGAIGLNSTTSTLNYWNHNSDRNATGLERLSAFIRFKASQRNCDRWMTVPIS